MSIKRNATAVWKGTGKEGSGVINTSNKFFDNTPYSFTSRFENVDGKQGTNPEELIAAAHSGCYSMALSFAISNAGFVPEELSTTATVSLDSVEGGFAISSIVLQLVGKVPGISEEEFVKLANAAKANCPVSKALSATNISLEINFSS